MERDDLLCEAGSLLLDYAGRDDKRGRLMRDVAEWIRTLADPDASPAALETVAEEVDRWNGRTRARDFRRERVKAAILGNEDEDDES